MTTGARWHEFAYEQTDIPAGMTVRDWHTQRARTRPRSRIIGVLPRSARRLRGTAEDQRSAARAPYAGAQPSRRPSHACKAGLDRLATPRTRCEVLRPGDGDSPPAAGRS